MRRRVTGCAMHLTTGLLLLLALTAEIRAVKHHDFKTCSQSGFCRRNRALADRAVAHEKEWRSPYVLSEPSFSETNAVFSATIKNVLFPDKQFSWEMRFQADGTARILMDEVNGLRQRYNEAASWSLVNKNPPLAVRSTVHGKVSKDKTSVKWAASLAAEIQHNPLQVTFLRDDQPHIVLNERGLLNMEHFRLKTPDTAAFASNETLPDMLVQAETPSPEFTSSATSSYNLSTFLDGNEDGMWEESFGGKKDSKPKGPESLSLDITFPGYEHVFGIPEHSGPLSLKTTRGGAENAYTDPYRLFNLDVFEYEHDSPMALYGAIPFMQAQRAGSSVGLLWLNGAETWIDIEKRATDANSKVPFQKRKTRSSAQAANNADKGPTDTTTTTHWMSESGILDLFIFLGPTSQDVFRQHGNLVGTTAMPQYFAIGYHQCRWNYLTQDDVLEVSAKFDEYDIPVDVIWLDIEYAEEHKYFEWDRNNFPEPLKMLDGLKDRGRQLVAIVDPHIKRVSEFYVYKEAQNLDILVKTADKNEFEGWCWTGSSSWVDFFNPKSWDWWTSLFTFAKFKDSARNLFLWNDMNEPSVFNGPEITMPKDSLFHGGWENRDIHNINGMLFHNATSVALRHRESPQRRPFVLSRSYFAGSQRIGAIWTGDNLGTWEHVAISLPMILSNSIAGMSYVGADVGGFFGNPSEEMLVRWYQAGIFAPFFRAHAHIDTKRREPYLFGEPTRSLIRDAIRLRYSLLPALYTAFWDSHRLGLPIATPQYVVHPNDPDGFAIDDQYYIGRTGILVKPVAAEGQTSVSVYVSDQQPYYDYFSPHKIYTRTAKSPRFEAAAPLEKISAFIRGGSIFPRRDIVRRSAILTMADPLSLVVAVDSENMAQGSMYLDDGDGYSFESGSFIWRNFTLNVAEQGKFFILQSTTALQEAEAPYVYRQAVTATDPADKWADVEIETIAILGLPKKPQCVEADSTPLYTEWTAASKAAASTLIIQGKGLKAAADWQISISTAASTKACAADRRPSIEERLSSPLCPQSRHYRCENKGHIPSCIPISRVNDGICDEADCCDGSDERSGLVQCPNRCKAINAEYTKRQEEEKRKLRVGSKIRSEYIAFGKKERAAIQANIDRLTKEIGGLQQQERDLLKVLEQTEARGHEEIEHKKASTVYRRLEDHQAAFKALRTQRQNLQTKIEHLSSILRDLQGSYNPNYQDMAVKGAVTAWTEWEKEQQQEQQANADDAEGEAAFDPTDVPSDDDIKQYEEEDILALLDTASDVATAGPRAANLFRLEDYLPAAVLPQYRMAIKTILELLERIGVLSATQGASALGDRPDVARARAAHNSAQNSLQEADRKLSAEKESLAKDWGSEWEWKKLDGTCIEKNTGEYTYELCFFGNAKQKNNKGHGSTNLGKFEAWHPTASVDDPSHYTRQKYAHGQKCWNGPERSVNVEIICGTKNELLSVTEPEKCEYQYKITSPAVCYLAQEKVPTTEKQEL